MLSEKLLELRKEAGLTQEDVALSIDVSRQTISNWENGTSVPTIAKTQLLLGLYGKSLNDIETGADNDQSLLGEWIGVLCFIKTRSAEYDRAKIIEVAGDWAALEVFNRKGSEFIIYNLENILGLRRLD